MKAWREVDEGDPTVLSGWKAMLADDFSRAGQQLRLAEELARQEDRLEEAALARIGRARAAWALGQRAEARRLDAEVQVVGPRDAWAWARSAERLALPAAEVLRRFQAAAAVASSPGPVGLSAARRALDNGWAVPPLPIDGPGLDLWRAEQGEAADGGLAQATLALAAGDPGRCRRLAYAAWAEAQEAPPGPDGWRAAAAAAERLGLASLALGDPQGALPWLHRAVRGAEAAGRPGRKLALEVVRWVAEVASGDARAAATTSLGLRALPERPASARWLRLAEGWSAGAPLEGVPAFYLVPLQAARRAGPGARPAR